MSIGTFPAQRQAVVLVLGRQKDSAPQLGELHGNRYVEGATGCRSSPVASARELIAGQLHSYAGVGDPLFGHPGSSCAKSRVDFWLS